MAELGSFALLFALASSAYCMVAGLVAVLCEKAFAAPLGETARHPARTRAGYLCERKDVVYENLRDLNFEYKTGKPPNVDYASLKSSLQERGGHSTGRNQALGKGRHTGSPQAEQTLKGTRDENSTASHLK